MQTHLFSWHSRIAGMALTLALALSVALFTTAAGMSARVQAASGFYIQTNLVSNLANPPGGAPKFIDPHLLNPWGIVAGPTTPFWISDNGASVSTLYNGAGVPFPPNAPLVVGIPGPDGTPAAGTPTGIVFNGTSDFVVSQNGKSGAALFIFATEDGTIAAWSPAVDRNNAILVAPNPGTAVYKGLALASVNGQNFLYAANFHDNRIDVYDTNFHLVPQPHEGNVFKDLALPAKYAPFGIANIGGNLYITYARQDEDREDDVPGPGHGFVDVFSPAGKFIKRFATEKTLNSPWGLALAPSNFGQFSNALLVGNFGDGRINAFNATTGAFLGQLSDQNGNPIVNDGLWGLSFGNGGNAGPTNTLFFTAGLNDEADGLFGAITVGQ